MGALKNARLFQAIKLGKIWEVLKKKIVNGEKERKNIWFDKTKRKKNQMLNHTNKRKTP